jgi:hypothetical protein
VLERPDGTPIWSAVLTCGSGTLDAGAPPAGTCTVTVVPDGSPTGTGGIARTQLRLLAPGLPVQQDEP